MEQPITALQTPGCDWLIHKFLEVNFSKLTDSNQIFRNDFVAFIITYAKFHHKLLSALFLRFMNSL